MSEKAKKYIEKNMDLVSNLSLSNPNDKWFISVKDAIEGVRITREEHKREMEEVLNFIADKKLEAYEMMFQMNQNIADRYWEGKHEMAREFRDKLKTRLCEKSTPFVPLGESSMGVSVPSKGTSKGGELKDGF